MHSLVLLSINQHTKFEVPNFAHSKDMIGVPKFIRRSRDSDHAH